jgi:hypothetical protein
VGSDDLFYGQHINTPKLKNEFATGLLRFHPVFPGMLQCSME